MKPASNRFAFTDKSVLKYTPPADVADHYAYDTETKGLSIRSQFGKGKVYLIRYRNAAGKPRKLRLGEVGQIALAEVRRRAMEAFLKLEDDGDPVLDKARAQTSAGQLFGSAIDGYLEKLAGDVKHKHRSASYLGQNTMYLKTHFKPLHGMALVAIDRHTVSRELKVIQKRGRITMNRARAALSAFFDWACRDDFEGLDNNPVTMTNKLTETPRARDLTTRELKAIWRSAEKLDNEFGDIVRLLMLTMQRRNEIAMLRTSEFHRKERYIHIPKERAKNKVASDIPLSDAAFDILDRHYDPGRKFMFGIRDTGYQGWTRSKAQIDALCGLNEHWTLHDFRRAGKTTMEQTLKPAVADNVSEAILNHAKEGLAKVYNGADYMDAKRDALNRYAKWLMEVVT